MATTSKTKPSLVSRAREFLTEEFVDGKSTNRFKCNICSNPKSLNGSVPSNLVTHFKKVHKEIYLEQIAIKDEESIDVQRLKTVHSCVEMVSINSLPFSALSSSGFRSALDEKLRIFQLAGCGLNLADHHVTEIKEKVREVADEIRNAIKSEVKNKIISVMVDSATRLGRSIFGINIQYRHNGVLKIVTLAMHQLKKSHTAQYLADVLSRVLSDYGIDLAQVLTITTDSGSNMLAMVKDIEKKLFESTEDELISSEVQSTSETYTPEPVEGDASIDGNEEQTEKDIEQLLNEMELNVNEILDIAFDENAFYGQLLDDLVLDVRNRTGNHQLIVASIKCAAHTLQLAVRDAINLLGRDDTNAISLCRKVAQFLRLQSSKNEMNRVGLKCILPALDVATRWNSTYRMIHDVLKCGDVIRYFANTDHACKLLLKKWHILKEMERVLHAPYLTTLILQKNEFSLSDFFGCLQIITMRLNKLIADPGKQYTQLAENLLHTLSQRKAKLIDNPLMICALYLDPRYKCEVEKDENKVMVAKLTLENIWERVKLARGHADEIETEIEVPVYLETTMEDMNLFYDELDQQYNEMAQGDSASEDTGVARLNLNRDKSFIAIALDKYENSTIHRMKSSESIWSFWEKSKEEFGLELYELASIVHSIPPTQASVERNFSALKFMLTDRRYNLSEDLLESLLLIHLNRDIYELVKQAEIEKLKITGQNDK